MSATILTPAAAARTGTVIGGTDGALAAATVTDGEKFLNTGKEVFMIINGSASQITVTIPIPLTVDGVAVASRTVTIAAHTAKLIGPFPPSYNDGSGYVSAVCSAVTTVTIAVINVPAL